MDTYHEILAVVLTDSEGEARSVIYEEAEQIANDLVNAGFINPNHT